jgi:DNA-binding NtrC family response regulator
MLPPVRAGEAPGLPASSLLGQSARLQELRRDLVTVARSAAPIVLLTGETGTGKDLAARVLHGESARAGGPFVAVNCTAVPASLLEDVFFGHDAGAFTDAKRARLGLLEEAQGGTLFLDEIGDLDLALQAKFLRVLEERRVRRLGASGDRAIDVRIVAATHVDLAQAVTERRFRPDLYYRLEVVSLALPPLRERPEDVLLLAEHFLARALARHGRAVRGFTPEAAAALVTAPWPGNVRQLAHAIERAVLLGREERIVLGDLRLAGPTAGGRTTGSADGGSRFAPEGLPGRTKEHELRDARGADLRDSEMLALARALELCDGSLSEAAGLLGVTRDTVRQRIRRYGLKIRAHVELPRRPRTTPEPPQEHGLP